MGLFDWIGPTSLTKQRPAPEQKLTGTIHDWGAALTRSTMLVHGPGATELLAGDGGNAWNSAVAACLNTITAAYPEAPLRVWKFTGPDDRVEMDTHPLQGLLNTPNPFLPAELIWAYVQWCKRVDGNAYLRKIRSGNALTGNVVELWPITPSRIEIRSDGAFISAYRYHLRPGKYEDIEPSNMIHYRMGLDDRDHRRGCGPLKALARLVSTDEQATRYADALLAHLAIPGLYVTQQVGDNIEPLTKEIAEETKAVIQATYGGDNVGSVAVLGGGMKMEQLGFNPQQMDLKALHRIPEERISAVLGVPAIVAGLGAGLDRSTFSNVREAREMFTEQTLVPSWRADAGVLNAQLTPDFTADPKVRIEHDLGAVRALQDDENAKATRIDVLVRAGTLTINEARTEMGFDAIEGGDMLMLPGAWAPTPPSHLAALASAPAPDPNAQPAPPPNITTLPNPDQMPMLQSGKRLWAVETKALSDKEILARFEAGLAPLEEDLADDLMGAFETIVAAATGRVASAIGKGAGAAVLEHHGAGPLHDRAAEGSVVKGRDEYGHDDQIAGQAIVAPRDGSALLGNRNAVDLDSERCVDFNGHDAASIDQKAAGEAIAGLVSSADHQEIRSLLRSAVLKSMRQAADDLAPLTDGPVRITRNMPAVKAAIAEMEARMPGIIETTGEDFGRLVRRLERRPGSVPIEDVQAALREYVAETYPGRSAAIARTELGSAHAKGVLLVAEKSGIATRVHIHDGTGDGPCAARNGDVLTLEEAQREHLNHPNCQFRLIPVISAA